jgi:predicted acyl esterase
VRVIEHTLIPLKDGMTLAARIWYICHTGSATVLTNEMR